MPLGNNMTGAPQRRGSLAAEAAAANRRRVALLGDRADEHDQQVIAAMQAETGWDQLVAADAALLAAGDPLDVALNFDDMPWTAAMAGER